MADEVEAKDNVAKARIINHMNADHHDSVIRYLEHYYSLSASTAYDGQMNSIDLRGMSLVCRGKLYRVAFNPPVASYGAVRERVVAMDQACLAALGRSDITIRQFSPPTEGLAGGLPFAVCLATFAAYSQRWWFASGASVEKVLGPGFAGFSWRIQPWLFWGMVVLHGAETVYMAQVKLRKHSVNPRTAMYWKWLVCVFVEGVFSIGRFDKLVKEKRRRRRSRSIRGMHSWG